MLHLTLFLIQNTKPAVAITTTVNRTHTVVAVVAADAVSAKLVSGVTKYTEINVL